MVVNTKINTTTPIVTLKMITSTNGCKHQNQHNYTNSNTQNDYQY